MKNKRLLDATALLAVLAILAACSKTEMNPNNPQEKDLPGKAFSVVLCDEQPGADKDSVYYFYADVSSDIADAKASYTRVGAKGSGRVFDVEPDVVEIIQTPYNTIRFESTENVNGASGNICVDIVRDTDRDYHLVYKSDGETDITLWNGSGELRKQKVIRVKARASVPCEAILIRLDGDDFYLRRGAWKSITEMGVENWATVKVALCSGWKNTNGYPIIHRMQTSFLGFMHTMPLEKEYDPSSKELISYWASPYTGQLLKDEIFKNWSTYDHAGRLFDVERMTKYEIVGTVPRNATPDCELTLIADPVCTNQTYSNLGEDDLSDNYFPQTNNILNYHEFNSKANPEFRWMEPIGKDWCFKSVIDVINDPRKGIYFEGPDADKYKDFRDGKYARKLKPSDIRYRKSLIFNRNIFTPLGTTDPFDFIGFSFKQNGEDCYYWAVIKVFDERDQTRPIEDKEWDKWNGVTMVNIKHDDELSKERQRWFYAKPYWFKGEKPWWEN